YKACLVSGTSQRRCLGWRPCCHLRHPMQYPDPTPLREQLLELMPGQWLLLPRMRRGSRLLHLQAGRLELALCDGPAVSAPLRAGMVWEQAGGDGPLRLRALVRSRLLLREPGTPPPGPIVAALLRLRLSALPTSRTG